MANPPPPYSDITGISRAVMKDNAQETIGGYNGNARPGELVVNLVVDPPVLYVGNNAGQLTAISSTAVGTGDWTFSFGNATTTVAEPIYVTAYTGEGASLNSDEWAQLYWSPNVNGNSLVFDPSGGGDKYSWAFVDSNGFHVEYKDDANSISSMWNFTTYGGLVMPGNIVATTANNSGQLIWVGNSSGDGAGYTTLEIIPDSTVSADQRLIIDPTAPNHIHIRAGGTQDNSSAILFIGGENSYVSVGAGSNPPIQISANNNTWTFETGGNLTFPDGTSQTTAYRPEVVYNGGSVTGNVTPNIVNGTIQKYTLTGNIVLKPVANIVAGQSMTMILTQDGTGGWTLDADIAYLFASGFQTLSTDSNAIDMINVFYDGSTYYATLTVSYS